MSIKYFLTLNQATNEASFPVFFSEVELWPQLNGLVRHSTGTGHTQNTASFAPIFLRRPQKKWVIIEEGWVAHCLVFQQVDCGIVWSVSIHFVPMTSDLGSL